MTTTATYLFAEAAGNEAVRRISWERIRDYGVTMYMNGIGEWDSENYLGHTMSAYLNLYDFAKDPQIKMHAKGILDWLSLAMAVKYWRGGWAGAVKRDYGNIMALEGNALQVAHLYYDDLGLPAHGDRDHVYHITSAYRPPMAMVELARGQIRKPVELFLSHPAYENWKRDREGRSGRDFPEYHETLYLAHHYRFGTLIGGNRGDVSGFCLISENSKRGVDYLKIGHSLGKDLAKIKKGKTLRRSKFVTTSAGKINIAQYRNLCIYVTNAGKASFYLLCAPGSLRRREGETVFLRHEKTWIALTAFGMKWEGRNEVLSRGFAPAGDILEGRGTGGAFAGFAMEVGEPETHGSFDDFVRGVMQRSVLKNPEPGRWEYRGMAGRRVGLKYSPGWPGIFETDPRKPWEVRRVRRAEEVYARYPTVYRDGRKHDWIREHFALYTNADPANKEPVHLGFREGRLTVISEHWYYEGTMAKDGTFRFSNRRRQ